MTRPLDIVLVAPYPYERHGEASFEFGCSLCHAALVPALGRQGHRVRVLAETPGLEWDPSRDAYPRSPGVEVRPAGLAYHSGATAPSPGQIASLRSAAAAAVADCVAERRPDLVVLGRESLAWFLPEICDDLHLPTALVAHGSPTAALPHGIYSSDVTARFVERLGSVGRIITVAGHLEAALRGLGLSRVQTIRNAVDLDRFRPSGRDPMLSEQLNIPSGDIVVGHFSGLRESKRPLDIVRSAQIVLRSASAVTYLVVGSGPLREDLEREARRCAVADRFRVRSPVAHRDIAPYYNLCDLIVVPSGREGFALVYREAQACGRVLLASDIAAAREAIVPDQTGVLFPVGDVEALAAATTELIADPGRRERIGRSSRQAVASENTNAWASACAEAFAGAAE